MSAPFGRESPSQRLGDFEIVRELGRGGMGVVYEARQVSLNRPVALKVLGGGLGLTPKAVQRFRREAEAAARLHHTNIVPVYATGEQDGTHFYAMELIDGPSLDRLLAQLCAAREDRKRAAGFIPAAPAAAADPVATGPYVPQAPSATETAPLGSSSLGSDSHYFDTVARMVAEVADALEYAHQQGVIHRDVKPSNLLLSPAGRLSLNDFGLARVLEQPGLTLTGEFVGTPAYMSPEQITAGRVPLDHRTDIYSLGATLYELLTLQPPFRGERRDQVLAQILQKEPKAPRRVDRKVPVDLETICLKALDKDPDRRYQTAGQMAEDLRRYVNRFAISARRTGPFRRLAKWVRRRPAVAAALAVALVLAVAAGFFAYQAHLAEQRRLAEKQQQEEQLLAEKRQNALEKALLVAMSGDLDEAEKAIREAERLGASTGQVRMLRGLVALHRGQMQEAVAHLEQAVELLPRSVAARSMLAEAYGNVDRLKEQEGLVAALDSLPLKAPEDYLFKAYLEAPGDTERGLKALDEAIHQHPSTLARLMRADVRVMRASATADPADIERALEDANAARNALPENPVALSVSLGAHLVAAGAYEDAGEQDKAKSALAQAGGEANALIPFPMVPDAVVARFRYFQYTGQEEVVSEELRGLSEQTEHGPVAYCYMLVLYKRGDLGKALEIADKRRGTFSVDWMRAIVLTEMPGGPERALKAYEELAARYQGSIMLLYYQTLLRLLGRKADAVAASLDCRQHADRLPALERTFFQGLLDYNCELISADELLRTAAGHKWQLCHAHHTIALTKLAEGDRRGARDHFRKAVATRFCAWTYDQSRMFLARMDQDPAWPPWIPVKK
jgi:serine/threonine protein kinase